MENINQVFDIYRPIISSTQFNNMVAFYNNQITTQVIQSLIRDHLPVRTKMAQLYRQYLGDVAIKQRTFVNPDKINRRVNNDFYGEIIDEIVGYLWGVALSYMLDKSKYSETDYQKIMDELDSFRIVNNMEKLDSNTGEMMSICGVAGRLLYFDKQGKARAMNIRPWEVIFVLDATTERVQYALIYYLLTEMNPDGSIKDFKTRVEWYDNKEVTYYITDDAGQYVHDPNYAKNPQPHMFDDVPVIRFANNTPMLGDFEKVNELIESYDRSISDIQNELEEFRLAYLAFYGVEPTQEVLTAARVSGALGFPEKKVETSAEYLTKNLDTIAVFVENHKKTLERNIYKFSKTVDMSDEKFSGSGMSGEARKWKLVALENKAITKEREFIAGLREQFRLLSTAWAKKKIKMNYEDLTFRFTRNLPVELSYEGDVQVKLHGIVSDETRLGLASFISDPQKEIERMRDEQENVISLDDINDPAAAANQPGFKPTIKSVPE